MRLRLCFTAALLAVGFTASAALSTSVIPSKPYPERLVNDFAGVFSEVQVDSLERVLVAFDDSTSNQICVVTVPTLNDLDVSDYAYKLANNWGIGTSKYNNGVLVLLKPRGDERYVDVSIQVGRGLEGAIPDVYASRIIRNIMGPYLSEDDYWPAITKGCEELKALACGEISEPRDGADDDELWALLIFVVISLAFFILVAWLLYKYGDNGNNNYGGGGGTWTTGPIVINGGGLGRGWGGGGGFGGGFGGFGGGSFGGGGASGHF